jgi:hypothetical protein
MICGRLEDVAALLVEEVVVAVDVVAVHGAQTATLCPVPGSDLGAPAFRDSDKAA